MLMSKPGQYCRPDWFGTWETGLFVFVKALFGLIMLVLVWGRSVKGSNRQALGSYTTFVCCCLVNTPTAT